jgi:hypothetical protein
MRKLSGVGIKVMKGLACHYGYFVDIPKNNDSTRESFPDTGQSFDSSKNQKDDRVHLTFPNRRCEPYVRIYGEENITSISIKETHSLIIQIGPLEHGELDSTRLFGWIYKILLCNIAADVGRWI